MIVDCAHYKDGARQHEGPLSLEQAARLRRDDVSGEFVWIGLHEPDPGELDELAAASSTSTSWPSRTPSLEHQRPKIEDYDDSYFIVLKTAHYHEEEEIVHFGEIHVFAGPGYVVAVRHGAGQRAEDRPSAARGAARPAQARARLGRLGDHRQGRRRLPAGRRRDRGRHRGGRERRLRRRHPRPDRAHLPPEARGDRVPPCRLAAARAAGLGSSAGGFAAVPEELRRYFRDIADHARRVDEQVSSQRELLTSVLEANLALVSVNQNEVIKKISVDRRDHRRPDLHRQRLRDELRAHAGARLSAGATRWRSP